MSAIYSVVYKIYIVQFLIVHKHHVCVLNPKFIVYQSQLLAAQTSNSNFNTCRSIVRNHSNVAHELPPRPLLTPSTE